MSTPNHDPQTPPAGVPPIAASPEFQKRTATALGGPASHPTQFRPIGKPGKTMATSKPTTSPAAPAAVPQANPAKPARVTNTTFDDDPNAAKHRASIADARQSIGRVITTADQTCDQLKRITAALKTEDGGKAEAKRQGFDIKLAENFSNDLDAVMEKYKPRASVEDGKGSQEPASS